MIYSPELEELIEAILTDGKIDEKERVALRKRAEKEGLDPDEVEVVVDSRLQGLLKNIKKESLRGKKCPHCGAYIEEGKTVCPQCGWALSDVSQNSSSTKLAELLKGVSSETAEGYYSSERKNIIDAFPVPNSKADLLEFLALCKAKGGINSQGEGEAYWNKYKECIDKARLSFSNDQDFEFYFDYYNKQSKRIPIKTLVFWVLGAIWAVWILYVLIWMFKGL